MEHKPESTDKPAKQKPGPKSVLHTTERPNLPQEWAHLRTWWAEHGARYNVREIAKMMGDDHVAIGLLLKGKGRSAASPERLDTLKKILALHYQEEA